MKTTHFKSAVSLTLGLLVSGVALVATADGAREFHGASRDNPHGTLLAQQDPRAPRATFRGQPEYPPPGYLAEFEDPPQSRSARGFLPGTPDAETGRITQEFAPGGYDRSLPGSSVSRQTPRTDFGSVLGRGTSAPPAGPTGYPGMSGTMMPDMGYPSAPGAIPGRGERPGSDSRWPSWPGAGAAPQEHQWPSAPDGRFRTNPEFPSERPDRGSLGASPASPYPPLPEFPPARGFERQR